MNIGIDIDDTLNDIYDYKRIIAENYIANNNLNYNLINADAYLVEDMFNWDKEGFKTFWESCSEELFSTAPVRPYAVELINKLKQLGHNIYIVTARSTKSFAKPYEISHNWLIKNNIVFDELIASRSDKDVICLEKNLEIFIDDLPENLEKISNVGVKALVMHNSHNKEFNHPHITRVTNWQEIYDIIVNLN